MKRYKKYKDSGVQWIGEIPEEWEVKKLKYCIDSNIGGFWGEEPKDNGNDVGCIRVSEFIKEKGILKNIVPTVRNVPKAKYNQIRVKKGSILIEKSGGGETCLVGNAIVVNKDLQAVYSNFITKIEVKYNFDPFFINYMLRCMYLKRVNYLCINQTTGIQNLNISKYLSESISIPTLNEQKIIATYLDHKTSQLEALISKKQELIETLKASRTKLISETVTKGLDKDVEMKDSGVEWIGEIPKDWKVSKLKFVTNLISIKLENYRFNKYIGLEHVEQCSGKLIDYGDPSELESKINSVFYKNNILFGKLRPYLTKCIVTETEGVCSDEFLVLESDKLVPKFLKFIMLNKVFINLVNAATYGAKMPRASWDFVGNIKVSYPNKKEQQAIATYLDHKTSQIDNLISKIEKQITLLKKAKEKLITEVVTGKINVTDL